MRTWTTIPRSKSRLGSPIGFTLVDDYTGGPPEAPVDVRLEMKDGPDWVPLEARSAVTQAGVTIYPGLGRCANPAGAPTLHCRAIVSSEAYIPLYREHEDAIEFDVTPYGDEPPPDLVPTLWTMTVALAPSPAYPYNANARVLRGRVIDSALEPVADALVGQGTTCRTLTDGKGWFALPLRMAADGPAVQVDAIDNRTGRSGVLFVDLPAEISLTHEISIT